MGLEDIWDAVVDGFMYIIRFEWLSDIWDFFGNVFESITSLENSPLTNIWFWAFYLSYIIAMWYLPSQFGLQGYSLRDKLIGSVVFFIIDWFVIVKFSE